MLKTLFVCVPWAPLETAANIVRPCGKSELIFNQTKIIKLNIEAYDYLVWFEIFFNENKNVFRNKPDNADVHRLIILLAIHGPAEECVVVQRD